MISYKYVCVLAVVVSGCVGSSPESAQEGYPKSVARPAPLLTPSSGRETVIITPSLVQRIGFRTQAVSIEHEERNPNSGEWEARTFDYSTSYAVTGATARVPGDYCIAGVSRWGKDVVERWTMTPMSGGYNATKPLSGTPIGVPASSGSIVIPDLAPQLYVPVGGRPVPNVDRLEIYRGDAFGGIRSICVDPDGRFVLIINAAGALYRMTLEGEPQIDQLYIAATIPHLEYCVSISPKQHVVQGRLYVLADRGAPFAEYSMKRTVLYDGDNDGQVDSYATLNDEEWEYAGYNGAVWADNFVTYL